MGYMRHHAIVVSSWSSDAITRAHVEAQRIFAPQQVSPTVRGVVNEEHTFLVGPDGSKEGWSESDVGDERRSAFREWLDGQREGDGTSRLRWVEVQYGDDRGGTRVVHDSDAWMRLHDAVSAQG